jgi:hypothetical protein
MGKITNEFRENAGLYVIFGAGVLALGGLFYADAQLKKDFNNAAPIAIDTFNLCLPTRTLGANANLIVYVPAKANLQHAEKQIIANDLHQVIRNFSAEDYSRNVPALEAQASATILGLTRKLDTQIRVNPSNLTPTCP